MRIGLFTETYRPSINGVAFVVETLKRRLEQLGHEVYVFCPARSIRAKLIDEDDDRIIRFRSVQGAFYDDYDLPLFYPPVAARRIRQLKLDVIHVLTPAQIGMLGMHAALRHDIPVVVQHSTDVYQYIEHYPRVVPGLLAFCSVFPYSLKLSRPDVAEWLRMYRPRGGRIGWGRDIVQKAVTLMYSRSDSVIALSRKSVGQLRSWQRTTRHCYDITLLPNGIDALPEPSPEEVTRWRRDHGIDDGDELVTFVGRLGAEKNLPVLIPMIEQVLRQRPAARLVFVGDFDFRPTLEAMARRSLARDRITFTGAMPRQTLGLAYGASSVFVFPSTMDTQGWVLHEAAHAGLPIVMVDSELSEVVEEGRNGFLTQNDPAHLAERVLALLDNDALRARFSAHSRRLAARFTEEKHALALEQVYRRAIISHYNLYDAVRLAS